MKEYAIILNGSRMEILLPRQSYLPAEPWVPFAPIYQIAIRFSKAI